MCDLTGPPDLSIDGISACIQGAVGKHIVLFQSVFSTNTVASELAETSEDGTVVLADTQEKGRGRLNRTWLSPPGLNIYMSIVLKPLIHVRYATCITMMAAAACTTALRKVTPLDVTIKWPNDLMISDKKIGGILTEFKNYSDEITHAIVGIGINVNAEKSTFPEELRKLATSLKIEIGHDVSRKYVVCEILNEISEGYILLKNLETAALLSAWKNLTSTIGKKVKVVLGSEILSGTAESVDEHGMLILRLQTGETRHISAGDVTVIR
jgi:BirA family biotin operon repressor/biotin-[acetyl-CoA-carboxylase] ligase